MSPVVDAHTHLAPRLSTADLPGVALVGGEYIVDGRSIGPPALYQPEALANYLRRNDLDQAVVSVPPPFFRQGSHPELCRRWCAAINDGLLAATRGWAELLALAYLPLDQPELAHAEYEHRREQDPWIGFTGSAGGGSVPLDDPALDPLWCAMSEDRALLFLHPGASPDSRLDRHYLANLLGNPTETALAAAQLVFGGVLRRHPGVSFLLAHCGGAVPTLVGRWQRGLDTARPGVAALELSPVEAVRRLWVDTLAHDPAALDLATRVIGTDRMVLGSDWPFPMGVDDPLRTIAHLDEGTRERIERTNPATLLQRPSA